MNFPWLDIHTGVLIGGLVGTMKVLKDVYDRHFNFLMASTELVTSVLMGYGSYEMGVAAELSTPILWCVTALTSANAFVTINIMGNPKLLKEVIKNFTKIDIDLEDRGDKKDDESNS